MNTQVNQASALILDHDGAGLGQLSDMVSGLGYRTVSFQNVSDLLTSRHLCPPCCVILELTLTDVSGLDIQRRLLEMPHFIPLIFLTACPSVETGIAAMKAGAIDYLVKPLGIADIDSAIRTGLARQAQRMELDHCMTEFRKGLSKLTPREQEVLHLIVNGFLNKQVAAALGTCEKTIKVHRGRVMRKMQVRSFAQLVQLAERASFSASFDEPSANALRMVTPAIVRRSRVGASEHEIRLKPEFGSNDFPHADLKVTT